MYENVSQMKPGKRGVEKLLRAFDENPLAVIAVGAAAMTAFAKVVDALSSIQGRRAYAKQVNAKAKRK